MDYQGIEFKQRNNICMGQCVLRDCGLKLEDREKRQKLDILLEEVAYD